MYAFPFLLFRSSATLFPRECRPTVLDADRLRFEDRYGPFRLSLARSRRGIEVRSLYVRPDLYRQGHGSAVVTALKRLLIEENLEEIRLLTVLDGARDFWRRKHGFTLGETTGVWRRDP